MPKAQHTEGGFCAEHACAQAARQSQLPYQQRHNGADLSKITAQGVPLLKLENDRLVYMVAEPGAGEAPEGAPSGAAPRARSSSSRATRGFTSGAGPATSRQGRILKVLLSGLYLHKDCLSHR